MEYTKASTLTCVGAAIVFQWTVGYHAGRRT